MVLRVSLLGSWASPETWIRGPARSGGDLLPGVYEAWVLRARAEIERQCTALYDLLAQAREHRGDLSGPSAGREERAAPPELGVRPVARPHLDLGVVRG